jgi:hypothetical protein
MPELYIANTTKQPIDFHFRLPPKEGQRNDQVLRHKIPAGKQVRVYQPADKETLEYIVAQHQNTPEPFCVHYTEAARMRGFVGLLFNYDKPVPQNAMQNRFEANDEAMQEKAQQDRMMAAAAASAKVDESTEGTGASNVAFESTVIEEGQPGNENPNALAETVAVEKGGKSGKSGRSGKGRGQ